MTIHKSAAIACAMVLLAGCAGDPTAGQDQGSAGPAAAETDGVDATGAPATQDGAVATGAAGGDTDLDDATSTVVGDSADQTEAAAVVELPRGGTEFFPRFQLFGYSGAPLSEGLGRLGIGDLDERVVELEERGEEYAGGRDIMPVLELIATIVHPVPGADGMFRTHQPDEIVDDYLAAARRHNGILLLNIQPGRADFIDEVKRWEDYLVEPDVGVALDPEWAVDEGQVPGEVYGRTSGEELDEVAAYLSGLVEEHNLPEKVMVYHQVHRDVVQDESELRPHDGVVIIKSVDGIGAPKDKVGTYDRVNKDMPEHVVAGFKLFYEEDAEHGPIMTGEQVLEMRPRPQYVLFE